MTIKHFKRNKLKNKVKFGFKMFVCLFLFDHNKTKIADWKPLCLSNVPAANCSTEQSKRRKRKSGCQNILIIVL